MEKENWYVYIVECSDKTLYTGVTKDIDTRVLEHNTSEKGAKYTRARRPVKLVYNSRFDSRSDAMKEEYRIKQLSKSEKKKIIAD